MTVVLKLKKDHETTYNTLTLRTRFEGVSRGIQAQGHKAPTDLIFRTWLGDVSRTFICVKAYICVCPQGSGLTLVLSCFKLCANLDFVVKMSQPLGDRNPNIFRSILGSYISKPDWLCLYKSNSFEVQGGCWETICFTTKKSSLIG